MYKKDDEFRKINYRPVTVLPALNIIFERRLSGHLVAKIDGGLEDDARQGGARCGSF